MGQHGPIVKTISPLHNFFFSPTSYYKYENKQKTNKNLQIYSPSLNHSTVQGHFVKIVSKKLFLQKMIYVFSPQRPNPLYTFSWVLSTESLWALLAFRTGAVHCVDIPSQKALPQPFWIVCSAAFTVSSITSCRVFVSVVLLLFYMLVCSSSTAAATNYHKFGGFKQHPWFISQFCRSNVQVRLGSLVLCLVLQSWSQGVGRPVFHSGGSDLLLISFGLWAESSSMWLFYGGSHFLTGCQWGHP